MSWLARPGMAAIVVGYFAVVLAIGLWTLRRTSTARDFFIAGQRLGLWVTALATMSAAMSGFVFVGGPGLTYRMGLSSLMILMPLGFTGAMLCWTAGRRLREMAADGRVLTIPEAVRRRYGSRAATAWSAVAVLAGSVGYLAAQVLAVGIVIETVFALPESLGAGSRLTGIALGTAVVMLYSVAGGMVAGVYTDLFQGALMLLAAVAVFGWAMVVGGGPQGIAAAITSSESFGPAFLDPLAASVWTVFSFFFVFGLGTLGQPHMLHKFYMIEDPRKLRFMPLILGSAQSLSVLVWLGIGLVVPALVARGAMPPLGSPDEAAPAFLLGFTPSWLAGLAMAGLLAAIMSSADSLANLGAGALVRDLPQVLGRRVAPGLRPARWATAGLFVAAAAVAWGFQDLVALLGTFAFGTFAAGLAPALGLGLAWRRVTGRAAALSIGSGVVVNLGLELTRRWAGPDFAAYAGLERGVLPSAMALLVSTVVLVAVSLTAPDARQRG